jgi:hypothetical protein
MFGGRREFVGTGNGTALPAYRRQTIHEQVYVRGATGKQEGGKGQQQKDVSIAKKRFHAISPSPALPGLDESFTVPLLRRFRISIWKKKFIIGERQEFEFQSSLTLLAPPHVLGDK